MKVYDGHWAVLGGEKEIGAIQNLNTHRDFIGQQLDMEHGAGLRVCFVNLQCTTPHKHEDWTLCAGDI